jgi:class 3 adenylate cyclase/tetratricopeptide (TPR) repeat protein
VIAGANFCLECGAALGTATAAKVGRPEPSADLPHTERRLVSVLFADLVGFTTLSEHRDPEEVRDLLSRYFDRCRALIERYGGTVEKFIGDAVMAVWGTPVAREDDAERAVRAALSLTTAVSTLGEEVGMPELRVRAGVLTGSAAVEVGAEGEGMVLGDTVNTASRLQSIADPGTVLVDDVTRRSSEAAIAYEDAGTHQVKGREEPVRAWRALRVVAGAGGARRGAGVEAPFVGRERELQTLIDTGEESATERRARLVAVVGEAGSGKSRLLWEFFKYLDGITEARWWHQGRCLSYGEGVAYWALAEMVRSRAGIVEEEDPASAMEKLRAAVAQHVPDERERRLVEPRLAHLLRLEERPEADRADLFSGWRLFFERLAEQQPVIMAFEDLQWADSGLLDFIDYLLEWSADYPILVMALGRSELRERRPRWDPLVLGPLEPSAIRQILDGLVPGLPEELVVEISQRAEGIPLYAVETVRMLQDRGLLVQQGAQYVLTGDVHELEIPETLHALVASRLDGLSADERALLQNAAVLGQAFTGAGVAALSDRREDDVVGLLDGLVRKQVLAYEDDPRSSERGQYVFLQGLLRTVAYGTLGRRTRKERHLAAAHHLRETWPGGLADIAEVLASHYLAAIEADPEADDVGDLRAAARETLTAAGRAAASLALGPEADRYFQQAAELAEDDLERAELLEQAGRALTRSADTGHAEERLRMAMDLARQGGSPTGGSAAVTLAELLRLAGRLDDAVEMLEPFRTADDDRVSPEVKAAALAAIGMSLSASGRLQEAGPLFDEALTTLESLRAWPALVDALISRGIFLSLRQRPQEGIAVLRHALHLAEEHDLPPLALRARFNLVGTLIEEHRFEDALGDLQIGLTMARERGDRTWERLMSQQGLQPQIILGRWDEALANSVALLGGPDLTVGMTAGGAVAAVAAARGDDALLARCVESAEAHRHHAHVDARSHAAVILARSARERGSPQEALELARPVVGEHAASGELRAEAFEVCVDAALDLGDEAPMAELEHWEAELPPAQALPLFQAGRARLLAELAHRRGDSAAARRAESVAVELLRSVGARPLLARALIDRWRRNQDDQALAEAREICLELKATRWLQELPVPERAAA